MSLQRLRDVFISKTASNLKEFKQFW